MTDAKLEALGILQEECAELIQIASKIRRFGENDIYFGTSIKDRFIREIGDVLALICMVQNLYLISKEEIDLAIDRKFEKLQKYSNLK